MKEHHKRQKKNQETFALNQVMGIPYTEGTIKERKKGLHLINNSESQEVQKLRKPTWLFHYGLLCQ